MKIFGKEVLAERTHTVELTQSEVDMIKAALSQCHKEGPSTALYRQFRTISTNLYRVSNEARVPAVVLTRY